MAESKQVAWKSAKSKMHGETEFDVMAEWYDPAMWHPEETLRLVSEKRARHLPRAIRLFIWTGVALAVCTLFAIRVQARKILPKMAPQEKTVTVQGRVLASVELFPPGSGLGPLWSKFLFGVESAGKEGKAVVPVEVMYAYYDRAGKLGDEFFDHAKLYEFRLEREESCDETVASVSYPRAQDTSGKPLEPINMLWVLDGVPKQLLKPEILLPCYILRQGAYKVVAPVAAGARTEENKGGLSVIEPGIRVGPLRLGDTHERLLELFPKKPNVDQEPFLPNCGTEYIWVDLEKSSPGTVTIRSKKDRVVQIESESAKYRTREGIAAGDSPERVREDYEGLKAFEYIGAMPEVLGGRPLIFWVDRDRGIAFAFAYSRANRERYLYKIVVFGAKTSFCPEGVKISSKNWRELVPYTLEPPDNVARLIE